MGKKIAAKRGLRKAKSKLSALKSKKRAAAKDKKKLAKDKSILAKDKKKLSADRAKVSKDKHKAHKEKRKEKKAVKKKEAKGLTKLQMFDAAAKKIHGLFDRIKPEETKIEKKINSVKKTAAKLIGKDSSAKGSTSYVALKAALAHALGNLNLLKKKRAAYK